MRPRAVGIAAVIGAIGAVVWFRRLPEAAEFKEMVALIVCAFLLRAIPELWPASWAISTMGQRGDGLIGFEAEVRAIEPLRVEAQGSVWQARLVDAGTVQVGEQVKVVSRQGLTLLVRANEMSGETA